MTQKSKGEATMIRDIYHAIKKRYATQQNYSEANFMKTTLIGIAATAALSLFGLPSHANCAYSGAENQQPYPTSWASLHGP
jgi:hypothetical protein